MDDIAAGASVTKPILYRTIGDKAALVTALAEWIIDDLNRAVNAASRAAPDPRAAFGASIRAYLHGVDADRNLYLFVNAAAPGSDEFRRLVDRSSAAMISGFSSARARAGLDPEVAPAWAWSIVGTLQIVATMWLRDDGRDLDTLAREVSELLWSGLAPTLDPPPSARDRTPGA